MTSAVRQGLHWGSGDGARLQGAPAPEPTLEDRLNWSHRQFAGTPPELIGHLLCMGLVTGVFRSVDPQGPWLWWLMLCGLALTLRAHQYWRLAVTSEQAGADVWLRWERLNRLLSLAQGLMTGLACGLYQPLAAGVHQSTLMIVAFVCLVGAIPSLSGRLTWFAAYAAAVAGPMGLAVVLDTSDDDHLHLVGSLVLLMALVVWMLKSQRLTLDHWMRQKAHVDHLRLQLTEQALRAEMGRLSAEMGREAQTQLMASAGHDLRQPLLALRLYGEQLRVRLRDPNNLEVLDSMSRGLHSLELLINDFLDNARHEAGLRLPRLQPVVMGDLYRRLQVQLGPYAFDRGLSLRWRGASRVVWGDPLMLERCLRNLVINAIAHTESGGVLVGARPVGDAVRIQVWDSGCGLSAKARQRLLDGHSALSQSAMPQAAGSLPVGGATDGLPSCGLGLGIVRRLTHLMGAHLAAHSAPGRGSVFELTFRRAPVSE